MKEITSKSLCDVHGLFCCKMMIFLKMFGGVVNMIVYFQPKTTSRCCCICLKRQGEKEDYFFASLMSHLM